MNKTKSRSGTPAPALIHETYTSSLANGTVEWGFCFKKPESDDIEFDLVIDAATPDNATAERINADFARMEWAAQAICAAAVNHVHAPEASAAGPVAGAAQNLGDALCPNCDQHPVKNHPQTGCVLAALVQVLRARGEYTEQQLHAIHANCNEDLLWDDIGDIINRLSNGEFAVQEEPQQQEQNVITMACADEDFAMREFALVDHDAQGKPDYACKHCGWMQSSTASGAAELLANASWSSQEERTAFVTKAAKFVDADKAAIGLKVFEVTAAGFDGGTDETDDLVFWIAAHSQDVVEQAIRDTGAKFGGEVLGWSLDDADYFLPGQSMALSSALLEKASEARNKNRPV